jgi:hypothetical protein
LPTDPRFRELSRNELLLRFTVHWLRKRETDLMDWWLKVLGIVWTREDVEAMQKPSGPADRVFLPLALACNAELTESLKQMFSKSSQVAMGDYLPAPGEEIVELGDMPPEEFKRWAAQATGASAKSDEPVTLEGEAADPRIERIREQIAHSKRKR